MKNKDIFLFLLKLILGISSCDLPTILVFCSNVTLWPMNMVRENLALPSKITNEIQFYPSKGNLNTHFPR